MKVGINLLLWMAGASESDFPLLDKIKDWGYDGFELPMFDPKGSPWKAIGAHADGLGLKRTAVTVMPEHANPVSEDAAMRSAGIDHLKRCLDSCAEGGIETLCGPLYSPVGKLVGRGRNDDEFKWAVEGMRDAAEHAEQAGVDLAVESLNRFETYVFNSVEDAARLVDEVNLPRFGLMYDTFHAHIEEKDQAQAIQTGGKRINHVHISENDRSTPGAGAVPWEAVFAALKGIGDRKSVV